jgi:hypothetical protein
VGCPDCQNGQIDDPYRMRSDRYGYSRYDYYDDDYFLGYTIYSSSGAADTPGDVTDASSMDFTEADGAELVQPDDQFENDMTES